MKLEILTPEKKIYEGSVEYIGLPGTEGSFGILNNHAPIISTLKKGVVTVRQEDSMLVPLNKEGEENEFTEKELTFDINGGLIELTNNKAILLAE